MVSRRQNGIVYQDGDRAPARTRNSEKESITMRWGFRKAVWVATLLTALVITNLDKVQIVLAEMRWD